MSTLYLRLISIACFLTAALAATPSCIISEINNFTGTLKELNCTVQHFHQCGEPSSHIRDIKPLLHIYHLSAELEGDLCELIDDIQSSCDFSSADSEQILLTLAGTYGPVTETLSAVKSKHCDFEQSIGALLTHRIIGGNMRRLRCLTMDLLRSFESRSDPGYKEIISSTRAELDAAFQSVLSVY